MTDLPWTGADSPPTRNGAKGRRCRRHEWWMPPVIGPLAAEWNHGVDGWVCRKCRAVRDPAVSRTNRNNRKRGNRTSHDLAVYLGGRNVEALKLPWDVEACGARIQSKRLASRPSIAAIVGLIEYITDVPADQLRAVYWVGAGQRIASGRVFVLWPEWYDEHGWLNPPGCGIHTSPRFVIEMPVAAFRDVRGNDLDLHGGAK